MKKEDPLLELFFNEPSKHWHFEQLLEQAKISRPQAARWLKKFINEGLVQRVKEQGKMPYYTGNVESPHYQTHKRLFALQEFEKKGLLTHLAGLSKAKTVILFGSMSRWDWYKKSDIDVFIYGDDEGYDPVAYEKLLHREIQTFMCKDEHALHKFRPGLLRNILEGYLVKGNLEFIKVGYA